MGVKRRLALAESPEAEVLRKRLREEWARDEDNDEEPVIIEERDRPNQPSHLYVIWSDWSSLSIEERSEIILDVYEEIRGREAVLDVTVALGLTPLEAERMRIRY